MKNLFLLFIIVFMSVGCVTEKKQEEVKQIIYSEYPSFESKVQNIITEKYGKDIFKKSIWEWQIEQSPLNNEFIVKYGCFRDLSLKEKFIGAMSEELTGELSFGFIKYNPKSQDKGVYIQLLINTKNKSIKFKK